MAFSFPALAIDNPAYAGVTGQDYSSYTVEYGANPAPLSVVYSNETGVVAGPNLIVNGDFSAGNKGFSTGYTLSTLTPYYFANGVTGIYQVLPIGDVNSAASYGDWRNVTTDPSGGNGDVFAADGATTPNTTVWSETVAVSPNTNYVFSFDAAEISNPSHSNAVFVPTINGVSGSGSTLTGNWAEYSFSWNSGSNTSATLSLTDANTSGPYNDFVLDDLSLRSVSTAQEKATWTYNPNGGYQIAYTGIVGSAFTAYTMTYAVNGRPASASYNNGMLANWTFNPDGSYAVAYSHVTGQTYTSYTMDYGANGDPEGAAYSNGMTVEGLPHQGPRPAQDDDARCRRLHPPLSPARAAERLPPHPPLRSVRRNGSVAQHRARPPTTSSASANCLPRPKPCAGSFTSWGSCSSGMSK
jgi:hypothetical protein